MIPSPRSSAHDSERYAVVISTFSRLSGIMAIIVMLVIGFGTCSLVSTSRSLIEVHLVPELGSGECVVSRGIHMCCCFDWVDK
jgi:hypothetical protein